MGSDDIPTAPFAPVPSAMLVEVPPELASACAAVLEPLVLLKVGHARAACERMLTTRPYVVVVGGAPKEAELKALREVALDIAAQVVLLEEGMDAARLKLELAAALRAARTVRRSP